MQVTPLVLVVVSIAMIGLVVTDMIVTRWRGDEGYASVRSVMLRWWRIYYFFLGVGKWTSIALAVFAVHAMIGSPIAAFPPVSQPLVILYLAFVTFALAQLAKWRQR